MTISTTYAFLGQMISSENTCMTGTWGLSDMPLLHLSFDDRYGTYHILCISLVTWGTLHLSFDDRYRAYHVLCISLVTWGALHLSFDDTYRAYHLVCISCASLVSLFIVYTPHFKSSTQFLMANRDNQTIPIWHHNLMANRDSLGVGLFC